MPMDCPKKMRELMFYGYTLKKLLKKPPKWCKIGNVYEKKYGRGFI